MFISPTLPFGYSDAVYSPNGKHSPLPAAANSWSVLGSYQRGFISRVVVVAIKQSSLCTDEDSVPGVYKCLSCVTMTVGPASLFLFLTV